MQYYVRLILFSIFLLVSQVIAIDFQYAVKAKNQSLSFYEKDDEEYAEKKNRKKKKKKKVRKKRKKRRLKRKRQWKKTKTDKESNISNEFEINFGHEASYLYDKKYSKIDINRGFLRLKDTLSYETQEGLSAYSFNVDFNGILGKEKEIILNSLYVDRISNFFTLAIGQQNIAWGESFGFQVADVVCPRDYRDPINSIRLSVTSLNLKVFLGDFTLQSIYSLPRNNKLPDESSLYFPISTLSIGAFNYENYSSFSKKYSFKSAEWGGKANYFFNFGLDLSLFYFAHWNRNILYQAKIDLNGLTISPVREKTETMGMSFSYALDKIVFRGDGALHKKYPVLGSIIGAYEKVDYCQAILGVDYTTDDSSNLGLQYFQDYSKIIKSNWIGLNFRGDVFNKYIEWALLIFRGINNNDFWIQPKITWVVFRNLSVILYADIINASNSSDVAILRKEKFSLFRDHDKIYSKITFQF